MKIDILLINQNGATFTQVENDNESINTLLGWKDAWNVPTIEVLGHKYLVVCSDTGKMRHEPVSALSIANLLAPKKTLQEPFIVGAIIITKFDGVDDFESLNEDDKELLKSRLFEHHENKPKAFNPALLILD